jgi:hypothetical protein
VVNEPELGEFGGYCCRKTVAQSCVFWNPITGAGDRSRSRSRRQKQEQEQEQETGAGDRSRKQEQEQGSGRQGHNLAGASPVVSILSVSDT